MLDGGGLGLKNPELDNNDATEEATATGRPRGAKNYSHKELKLLVSCVKEFAPITSQDFAAVAEVYNRLAEEQEFSTRSAAPLRQRFEKVRETYMYPLSTSNGLSSCKKRSQMALTPRPRSFMRQQSQLR